MRKIFSFLAAVLFAGSMMAEPITINATDVTTIETGATTGLDVTLQDVQIVWEGAYYNNENSQDFRIYAGKALTLTATENISKVEIVGYAKKDLAPVVSAGTITAGASFSAETTKATWEDPLLVIEEIKAQSLTITCNKQMRAFAIRITFEGGETPVEPTPTELQAVSDSTTWDFSKITANTANALYDNEGIHLTDESTPSKNDEMIYVDYTEDFMTFAEDFNAAALAFKGEYPIRKNKYCQAGTLHFKAAVPGTIVVKFSDTGSSASATAVKRYLVVNGEQTEYWTSRENNGTEAYDAQLNVVSGKIAVPAGDVTITGSSAIVVYYVTFVPAQAVEPVLADPTNCAEAAEAALSVSANNELYNDGKEYSITGYVTAIQTAFNATNKNITFWMADAADGGKVLEAYRAVCETAEAAPTVGDKVTVTGKLTKYNSTPEFAQGCTYVIVEKSEPATNLGAKTIAEFLALKNTKDTCILTGVVANIVNTTYGNFDLCNEADTVYIYGLLTPDGQSKQFESLNVAEKDTLTVLAIYTEYNGKPQVSNAIFVEVKKAAVVAQEIEITASAITTPGSVIWTDYVAEDGWWQITAVSDAYYVSLSNIFTTEVPGVYTVDDLDAEYSGIYAGETEISLVSGSVTIAVAEEGTITAVGEFVGSDGNTYKLNFTYVEPKAENTVNVNIPNAELLDYVELMSTFVVSGKDANDVFVQFYFGSDNIAGEYTEEDINPQYSGVMVGEETISIYTAAIKIVANADGSYTLTADILCYNNTLYKVTMTIPAQEEQGIDEVNAAVKATKTLINGQLVIEKAGVKYNAQGAVIR